MKWSTNKQSPRVARIFFRANLQAHRGWAERRQWDWDEGPQYIWDENLFVEVFHPKFIYK